MWLGKDLGFRFFRISVVRPVMTEDATQVCNVSEHGFTVTDGANDDVMHDNVDSVSL